MTSITAKAMLAPSNHPSVRPYKRICKHSETITGKQKNLKTGKGNKKRGTVKLDDKSINCRKEILTTNHK